MRVNDLARQAADSYLETGSGLNSAIAKIAKDNELTPTQIQRVVESANHEVVARIRKTAKEGHFVPDGGLASREKVLELIGAENATEKTASDMSSFFMLDRDRRQPRHTKLAAEVQVEGFVSRMNGDDAAKSAMVNDLQRAYVTLTEYAKDIRVRKHAADLSQAENFTKFIKEARRLMLEESVSLQLMFGGVPESVHRELATAIFKDAHEKLSKTANSVEKKLLKEFDPEASKDLGMRIINGNQPLFIHLRATAGDAADSASLGCCADAVNNIVSGVVTAIHSLNSSKDVKKYIENEVQPFANNVQRGVKYAMAYVRDHAADDTWLAKTANFGGVAAFLDKIGRIFQFINQGSQGVESMGRNANQFLQDLKIGRAHV